MTATAKWQETSGGSEYGRVLLNSQRPRLIPLVLLSCWVWGCRDTARSAPATAAAPAPALESVFIAARDQAGPAPVVVLLHGLGANEHDLLGLAGGIDPHFAVIGVRAPITLSPGSYAWYHFTAEHDVAEAEASRQALASFLRALRSDARIDASRIYLVGFSQGAILSFSLALTEPSLFAGAVAIAGRVLPELENRAVPLPGARPQFLVLHGRGDRRIPFESETTTQAVLTRAGLAPEFLAFEAGHEITPAMAQAMSRWLNERLKPQVPSH